MVSLRRFSRLSTSFHTAILDPYDPARVEAGRNSETFGNSRAPNEIVMSVSAQTLSEALDEVTHLLLERVNQEHQRGWTASADPLGSHHQRKRSKLGASACHRAKYGTGRRQPSYSGIAYPESLACPFYKENRQKHQACLTKGDFSSIEDVKQHLYLEHRQPISCPICQGRFPTYEARNSHLRHETCQATSALPVAEGLTEQQVDDMSAVDDLSQSQKDAWFALWDIVLPECHRPTSPFYTDRPGRMVLRLRAFWEQYGQGIVADVMRRRNLQRYEIQDEERNLQWLYETALQRATERTLDSMSETRLRPKTRR